MPRIGAREGGVATTTKETVAIVAAAIDVRGVSARKRTFRRREQWQEEVWTHYDNVGELRYAVSWFANALSRAKLKVAKRIENSDDFEVLTEGPAVDILNELVIEGEGQTQLLKSMGQQYFLPGEWYLVNRKVDGSPRWEVASQTEINKNGDRWDLTYEGEEKIELTSQDVVLHMHVPHPKNRMKADSPTRGARTVLRQITSLSRHIDAQVYSRLAGAGLLAIPSEMTFATPPGHDIPEGADPFMTMLVETAAAAIEDPGDPAALVPLVIKAPGEYLEKIQHLKFWTELDQQAVPQLDAGIRRLALTLEMPPEVLLGIADVNHWGAWQVDESSIKAHIEPALAVICAGLTVAYLRDALAGINEDPNDYIITFDTSALRMRPNKSKEAIELWDRGAINDRALRRETGFDEDDAMDEEEQRVWLLRKVASGSATPEMVMAALMELGVRMKVEPGEDNRQARPDPSLVEHPDQSPPERPSEDPEQVAALFATCDALVMRAMELAGNRLNNGSKARPPNVVPEDTHMYLQVRPGDLDRLLDGAWKQLPRLLAKSAFHPEIISRCLDSYCRTILVERRPHSTDELMKFVKAGAAIS